jgi:hypothetical protein
MKKIVITFLFGLFILPAVAQTIIHTKDGRTINVPIGQNEISSIEFTNTTADNPFIGKWLRKEGSKVAEYIEITQTGQVMEFFFTNSTNGTPYGRGTGHLINGNFEGKGSSRLVRMKINSQNQIEYTSSDPNGENPWSCVWLRAN